MNIQSLAAVVVIGIGLAGCVSPEPYDPGRISLANAQMNASTEACSAKLDGAEFANYRQYADCMVASRTQFAATIKIREPGYLAAFAQRAVLIADQVDAGRITRDDAHAQLVRANKDFMDQLRSAYQENQRERAEETRQLQAVGQGLSNAGAALQADTPPPPPVPAAIPSLIPPLTPQVTCNTIRMGSNLQTVCR